MTYILDIWWISINKPESVFFALLNCQLIGRAKRAPHWAVQSRFRVIYICMSVCLKGTHTNSAYAKMRGWKLRGPNTRMLKSILGS